MSFIIALNLLNVLAGILASLDGQMNVALEQAEEFSEGQLKASYGDCLIRGSNVLYFGLQPKKA